MHLLTLARRGEKWIYVGHIFRVLGDSYQLFKLLGANYARFLFRTSLDACLSGSDIRAQQLQGHNRKLVQISWW